MRMSNAGIALIKEFEGCRLKAYRCPAGVWTIGYGHTSAAGAPDVNPDSTITQDEAEEILRRDLQQYERGVEKMVKVMFLLHKISYIQTFVY